MIDEKEILLNKILDELKTIRRELERTRNDMRVLNNIEDEVKDIRRILERR